MAEYYTPSIDEFHPGFEYEMLNKDDQWIKYTCGKHWKHAHEYSKEPHKIRVKYLDSDDIEDVGWEYFANGFRNNTKVFKNEEGHELWFISSPTIYVKIFLNGGLNNCVFCGKIYNKSELRFQMDRLEIEC